MKLVIEIVGTLTAIIVCFTAYIKYKEVKEQVLKDNKDGKIKSITIGDSSNGNIAINAEENVEVSTASAFEGKEKK